jgi:hypothetical protein
LAGWQRLYRDLRDLIAIHIHNRLQHPAWVCRIFDAAALDSPIIKRLCDIDTAFGLGLSKRGEWQTGCKGK